MIVTLTPNPSVDRTVFLDDLALGSVNRSQRSWSEPSGKGVNVALALHAHGVDVRAVVTAGGPVGAQLRQMLDTTGLDTVIVPIAGEIRSNISLTQPDGTVTKVNEAGPELTVEERDAVLSAVAENRYGQLAGGAGSLPSGVPADWYGARSPWAAATACPSRSTPPACTGRKPVRRTGSGETDSMSSQNSPARCRRRSAR